MPLVQGVGDEVTYAALAAAAAPLAVALSPNFVRKQPANLFQRGFACLLKVLRLVWAKVRLWLVKRAQAAFCAAAASKIKSRKQVTSREAILKRLQEFSPSSTSSPASPRNPDSCCLHQEEQEQQQLHLGCSGAAANFETHSFAIQGKESMASGGSEGRERETSGGVQSGGAGVRVNAGSSSSGGVSPPSGEICSICHDDFTLPCQANCGHWFCAECILRVWHHNSALSACKCPICRRTITLLLVSESVPGSAAAGSSRGSSYLSSDASLSPARRLELLQDVAKYNRLFGGVPVSLWQRVLDMPLLLRRMGRDLVDPVRALSLLHNVRFVVCIVCVGVYVLSPLDIISESLVGLLGLVDDVVFLVCVAFYLTVLYRSVLLSRAQTYPAGTRTSQE